MIKILDDIQNTCNFIIEICTELTKLEAKCRLIKLDMSKDINYVSKAFSIRLFEQLNAMLLLKNNENHILVARSMFEGAVYFASFHKDPQLLKDWRNYSFVLDQIRVNSSGEDEGIPDDVTRYLNENKSTIDNFKNKNGDFYLSWTKNKSIKELSSIAELEYFYKKYYAQMSDYHHWGNKSFGIRYECTKDDVQKLDTAEIALESLNTWCMSL